MRRLITATLAGMLFGAGMVISDMINPARVLAFLDVTGAWDYSLALVMGGALIPSTIAWQIRKRMVQPLFDVNFQVPTRRDIDWQLVTGAALFGIGWGLVGFCPGPAIAALALGQRSAWIFVAAMLLGMVFHKVLMKRPVTQPDAAQNRN